MNTTTKTLFAAAISALTLTTAQAASLLTTDFDSHATAAATNASLNDVTSGGTWSLNTGRADTTYSVVADVTDKALLLDDSANTTSGTNEFATLNLNSAATFTTDAATFATRLRPRRTGGNRDLFFEFLSGSDVVASVLWENDGDVSEANDSVYFNGSGTSSGNLNYVSTGSWDEDNSNVHDLSAVFSGSNVTLNLGGVSSGSISVLNSATTVTGFRISSEGSSATDGVFFDDISITQVPEPGSLALLGLGGLCLLRRRRD